jgi:7-cyano-7-deazaguanine synthase
MPSALVLFSGGQDSTVCLAWALARCDRVETIGFDYRQRHSVELDCRPKILAGIRERFPAWAPKLGEDHMLDLGVPGRNLVFLTFAAAVAYRRGITGLVGGMCETDFSGYPDCRRDTIDAMAKALTLGLDRATPIETPLMHLDKSQTWELAFELGGQALVDLIIEDTHTCYLGDRTHRHEWGYGCGTCPACDLRAKGYAKWRAG